MSPRPPLPPLPPPPDWARAALGSLGSHGHHARWDPAGMRVAGRFGDLEIRLADQDGIATLEVRASGPAHDGDLCADVLAAALEAELHRGEDDWQAMTAERRKLAREVMP